MLFVVGIYTASCMFFASCVRSPSRDESREVGRLGGVFHDR